MRSRLQALIGSRVAQPLSSTARQCDDRPYMFAAKRRGEPSRGQTIHDLHMLQMTRGRHHLQQRAIEWQCALDFPEIVDARLADQFSLASIRRVRVGV